MRCQIKFCVCFSSTAKQEKAHHPPMQRSFCIPHTFSALFSFALRVYSLLTDVNQGDQTWLTPLAFANHVTGEKKNFADLNQKTSSWRTPDNKIQHSQITRSFPSKSKENISLTSSLLLFSAITGEDQRPAIPTRTPDSFRKSSEPEVSCQPHGSTTKSGKKIPQNMIHFIPEPVPFCWEANRTSVGWFTLLIPGRLA